MADDAKELRQHHADDLRARRHLDAGQLLDGQAVGEIVHHAAEIVDAIGVRNVGVPRLALAHLFGAAVVEADVGYCVDDLFAIELQERCASTPCVPGCWGPTLRNMKSVPSRLRAQPHSSGRKRSASCFGLPCSSASWKTAHLRRARGVLLAQRMALPGRRHQDAPQMRMAVEAMPNMSQTSRSYQLAAGQRSVMVGSDGESPPRGTLMRTSALRSNERR